MESHFTKYYGIYILVGNGNYFIVDDNGGELYFNHFPTVDDIDNYRRLVINS